jgi:alkylhydroperoxidase family enzyme
MPRLAQVSRADADRSILPLYDALFGQRDPVAQPGTATGTPGNWWTVFALVPECFNHSVDGFRFYRGRNRKLSPRLRELGQTRAGYARGSQFVFSQHCKSMRAAGFSEEQIAAIPSWASSDLFSDVERAVLAYTDDLVLSGGRVPDGTFAALKRHLSDIEILELTYITCMYEMHATMCRALHLEYDDIPERVTEIPAPDDDPKKMDFMGAVDRDSSPSS